MIAWQHAEPEVLLAEIVRNSQQDLRRPYDQMESAAERMYGNTTEQETT